MAAGDLYINIGLGQPVVIHLATTATIGSVVARPPAPIALAVATPGIAASPRVGSSA